MSKLVLKQQLQALNAKKMNDLNYQNFLESYIPKIGKLNTQYSSLAHRMDEVDLKMIKLTQIDLDQDNDKFLVENRIFKLEKIIESLSSKLDNQQQELSILYENRD